MTSIFQIDWIFVDTIIIIFLLLLLFSVKIFKMTHRWRNSFSNQSLEHICFSQAPKNVKNDLLLPKKWSLTRNSSLKNIFSTFPYIIILRSNYKRKFLKILTEGLTSYGFNVINIKIKIKHLPDNSTLEKIVNIEWKSLISAITDEFKLEATKIKSDYIVLNYSKSLISYELLLSDPNNLGFIIINPKLNKKEVKAYYDIVKNKSINTQIYTIFSKKSLLILKNRHLKKYLKDISPQKASNLRYLTIEKATYSFKYYETILLGIIIDIIENELLKSKT